jgi:hypothetical protein
VEKAAAWIALFAERLREEFRTDMIVFGRWDECASLYAAARREMARKGVRALMRGSREAGELERASLAQALLGSGRLLLTERAAALKAALGSARWEAARAGSAPARAAGGGIESLVAFENAITAFARYLRG